LSSAETREALAVIGAVRKVEPVSEERHDKGLKIAERYGLAVCDAMIVASALLAGCETLLPEAMQDGQVLDGRPAVGNPFL
jgi:predicted nucleic acid-binding protein